MKSKPFFLKTRGMLAFTVFNYLFLSLLALVCLVPIVNVLAISFSSSASAAANLVGVWPVNFTLQSYNTIFQRESFWTAFFVSTERTVLGTIVNNVLVILMAYPLSKSASAFRGRNVYVGLILFVMLFNGGLIPTYLLVRDLGLINSIWVLVLPGAVVIGNVILMMNFIRNLPAELEEAAVMDGASSWQMLTRIIVPVSMPVIATVTLFHFVGHWNEWFTGLIYMNDPKMYPLQTVLQTMVVSRDISSMEDAKIFAEVSDRTIKAAQIFITMLPIMAIYPFLQRYFIKGITVGAVKG